MFTVSYLSSINDWKQYCPLHFRWWLVYHVINKISYLLKYGWYKLTAFDVMGLIKFLKMYRYQISANFDSPVQADTDTLILLKGRFQYFQNVGSFSPSGEIYCFTQCLDFFSRMMSVLYHSKCFLTLILECVCPSVCLCVHCNAWAQIGTLPTFRKFSWHAMHSFWNEIFPNYFFSTWFVHAVLNLSQLAMPHWKGIIE